MPGISGRLADFAVSNVAGGAGAYTLVGGLKSISAPRGRNVLDDTEFGDAWDTYIAGLLNGQFVISGNSDPADAGRVLIESAFLNATELWGRYRYNGTNGRKQQVIVESYEETANVNETVTWQATLRGTGAQATV